MTKVVYQGAIPLRLGDVVRLADIFHGTVLEECPHGHSIGFTIGQLLVDGGPLEFQEIEEHCVDTVSIGSKEVYFLLDETPENEIRSVEISYVEEGGGGLMLTQLTGPVEQVILSTVRVSPAR